MTTSEDTPEHPFLTNFLKDLYHCSDCGYCVEAIWEERDINHICATLQSHSPGLSYSGQGYIKTARAWLEGEDLPLSSIAEHAFTCTPCGNCERICPIGMRPMEINRALRSELIMRDLAPDNIVEIQKNVLTRQNPMGETLANRYNWAAGYDTADKEAAGHTDIAYLPGCASAYSRPQEAQAVLSLVSASGLSVQLLGDDDRCCGAPLKELGFVSDAENSANQLADALAQRSYSALLTSGCECANNLADSEGLISLVAWLFSALDNKQLSFVAKGAAPRVVCIESCQATMAPQSGTSNGNDNQNLYALLTRLGVDINDGRGASRFALCCGAAGGAPSMHPASSADMARARIGEAVARTVLDENEPLDAIVSIDPRCVAHLDSARTDGDPPIYGLAEFLENYFKFGSEAA